MYTDQKEFNYEQPEMIYDKKTGDVKIIDKSKTQKKTIIRNYDDLEKERALLLKELNQKSPKAQDKVDKMATLEQRFQKEYEIDPSQFQVFSRDAMRVDVGLMIQRPPIFVHLSKRDIEFLKLRSQIMNEYHCNTKQHIEEFEEGVF